MNNGTNLERSDKTRYKLFRRANGTVGFISDPLGNSIGIDDAVDIEELELEIEQVQHLRASMREEKLDFVEARRAYGKTKCADSPENKSPANTTKNRNKDDGSI